MADNPMLGEIRMFAGNFAPLGWALCQGQLLAISENEALFSLIGTTYGGDGMTNFALPDLRGRVPIHQGQGPGLSNRTLGEQAGVESVTLTSSHVPQHTHVPQCRSTAGSTTSPVGQVWAADGSGTTFTYHSSVNSTMANNAIGSAGGSQPHDNIQPYLAVNFIICLVGFFPVFN